MDWDYILLTKKHLFLENNDSNHYRIARHNTRVNRKEARKQERSARKQKKSDFFSHSRKRPAEDELESPQRKKTRHHTQNISEPRSSTRKAAASSSDKQTNAASKALAPTKIHEPPSSSSKPETHSKTKKPEKSTTNKKSSASATSVSKLPRSRVEEEEDRYIRLLEQKLGHDKNSRKKTHSAEADDGLEDLFSWADSFSIAKPQVDVSDTGENEYSEDEGSFDEDEDLEDSSSDEDGTEEGDDENWDEEWGGVDSEAEEDGESSPANADPPKAAGAYVPPHLRKAKLDAAQPSEEIIKLTRQLKGLLNRMSEQNISSIIDGVEDIYRNNRRNDVTSTLTKLIIDGISSHSTLLDSYVVLHGAFVSSLHKLVGVEFAAHFVQETIDSYEKHYAALSRPTSEAPHTESSDHGKECSNLIVLISELYNFQVISCVLVFDIVRSLLEGAVSEFDVELLLKILRSSGQQLRQDDPLALKDIVQIVQDKVSGKEDTSSRTRFMVETLMNLKNNKVKKVAAAQSQGGDAMERMKKFLTGLSKTRTSKSPSYPQPASQPF
ncbi:hypothetical protein H1R20_g1721, partial [Candolleomyces eurysporus]